MRTLGSLWVLCVAVALTVSLVGPAVLASSADGGTDALDSRMLQTAPEYMRFVNINGFEFDPCDAAPQILAGLTYGPDVTGGFGYYIAQFDGPVTQTMKNDLYSTGAELLFYVNYNAFVVRADANVLLEIGELSTVRWVDIFEPAYKLSPRLSEEFDDVLAKYSEGASLVSDGTNAATYASAARIAPYSAAASLYMNAPAPTRITVEVLTFETWNLQLVAGAVKALGGTDIVYSYGSSGKIRAEIDRDVLDRLAFETGVMWIDRYIQPSIYNDIARWVIQSGDEDTFATPVHEHGIWGTGQTVTVCDSGIDYDHDAFEDTNDTVPGPTHRKVTDYYIPSDAGGDGTDNDINHGTHVSGTVAGDDGVWHVYDGEFDGLNGTVGPHDGQAFDAMLQVQDLSPDGYYVFPPSDYHDMYQEALDRDSWIHTNSWGSAGGYYTTSASQTDDFVWNNQDFLVLYAAGNAGIWYNAVNPDSVAKNAISVGATYNGLYRNDIADFSSRGPATDGRIKPDIMTPGVDTWSARGGDPYEEYDDYWQLSGTSMATPTAAGAATLIRQYYMDGWYPTGAADIANGFTPSAALIKATLINSAVEMTGLGAYDMDEYFYPNDNQGWGRVTLDEALFFQGDLRGLSAVDERTGLSTGESAVHQVAIGETSMPVEFTLVWSDYPGTPYTNPNLVNDLDLVVTSPSGTVYRGNQYIGYAPGESEQDPADADHLNNVECVLAITGVESGIWTVEIEAYNIPYGPQSYALVTTGGIASSFGLIGLDESVYQSSSTVEVRVVDMDLNLDDGAPDTAWAWMSSTTETTPENVALTETGDATAVFVATIPLDDSGTPIADDGLLQVLNGDYINATYLDEDDGLGSWGWRQDFALVDDTPPIISDVTVSSVRFNRATINWLTDEPADSSIWYGTSTPDLSTASTMSVTDHSLAVSGLLENTTYYFWVESTDEAGNTASDDNGSAYYTFRTTVRPPEPPANEDWPTFHNNEARVGVSPTVFRPPLELVWQTGPNGMSLYTSPVEAEGVVVSTTIDGYIRARDAATGTVLWGQPLGDSGAYTGVPAIADGVVYTVMYEYYGGTAYALDLMTGDILWEVGSDETGLDLNARISLAIHDGMVFGHSWDGYTYALDAADGTVIWTHYEITEGWVSGLSVSEGMVFATTWDGSMYAMDEYSGDLVWRVSLGGEAGMSPLVSGGVAYVGTMSGVLYALDSGTGDVIWSKSGFYPMELSTPAFDGDALYFGSWNYTIFSVDAADGSIIWQTPTYGPVIGAAVYAAGYVYALDEGGTLYSIDAATGDIVDTDYLTYMSQSALAVSGGWIWTEDYEGRMYAFRGLTPIGVDVTPDHQERSALPGTTVNLNITVANMGFSGPDIFDISLSAGTGGWSAEMFYSDGVTPIDDTDGDLVPDTGVLAFEEEIDFVVAVTVPSGAVPGDNMTFYATFTSSSDLNVSGTATMTMVIPPPGVELGPGVFQQLSPGESAMVPVEVTNAGAAQDTIDMTVLTSANWATGVYFSDGTTQLTDTDSDGTMDVGALSGLASITVLVSIDVPSDAENGMLDKTVLTGLSSLDPAQEDSCIIITEMPAGESTDWPQFRHDSARTGIAPQDYEGPLELNWTYYPEDSYYSLFNCPVVSERTVFLVEASGDLTALDLGTGELRWQKTIGYLDAYGGTAAVAYGYVYSVFVSDYDTLTLSAVDELTGETAWSLDYSIGNAIASLTTPVVDSGMVFWSELESGTVHANDALTGEELWAYGGGGWMYQGPTYWAGMVFASNEYGSVTALDAFSGEVLWTTNAVGAVLVAPTIADGVMYIGDMNGALVAFDPFTGEELWRNSTGLFLAGASPLVADGIVFACAANLYSYESSVLAFDAATGDGIWSSVLTTGYAYSSPAYNNGTIYCMFESGEIFALDAETGDTVQYIDVVGYCMSSPAIANGHLIATDVDGMVYTFNFQDVGYVTSVETDPEALELEVATEELVSATAYDAYGSPAEDPLFAWESASGLGTIVPVTGNGDTIVYVAGANAGADTLECTCSGLTVTVEVTILPGTGDRLEMHPVDATVVAGRDYQFSAAVTDMFGNELDDEVITWTTSAGVISSSGLLTASTVARSGTVTAHAGTMTAVALVTIVPDELAEVVADPTEAEVGAGSFVMLSAEGLDQYGNVIPDAELTWSADDGVISVLDEYGRTALLVAPTAPGTVTANVSSGDIGADVELTVVAGSIARMEVDPAAAVLETGETMTLSATAVDLYGNELDVGEIAWSTTIGSVTPASGGDSAEFASGDEPGSGTITVTASGKSATVSVTVIETDQGTTAGQTATLVLSAVAVAIAVLVLILYLLGRKGKGGQDQAPAPPPEAPPPAQ